VIESQPSAGTLGWAAEMTGEPRHVMRRLAWTRTATHLLESPTRGMALRSFPFCLADARAAALRDEPA
jgi:hypothetical protein